MTDTVIFEARIRLRVVDRQLAALQAEHGQLVHLLNIDAGRGLALALAAETYLREHGPMHYRDLADEVGAGGDDPAATMLTTLHRYPGVCQVQPRSGIWEAR